MPLTALGLLLAAAILHTTWNLIVKRAQEKQVFIWCALIAGAICFSPLLLTNPVFPISLWPYLLSSALFEAVYYITLIRAYENGDFSLAYPMAPGVAPGLLGAWAALFLAHGPRLYGVLAIGSRCVGAVS